VTLAGGGWVYRRGSGEGPVLNENETETNLGTSYSVFLLEAKCAIVGHLYECGSTSDRVWPSSLGEVVRGEGRVVYRG
jgi:hypothetical protein